MQYSIQKTEDTSKKDTCNTTSQHLQLLQTVAPMAGCRASCIYIFRLIILYMTIDYFTSQYKHMTIQKLVIAIDNNTTHKMCLRYSGHP